MSTGMVPWFGFAILVAAAAVSAKWYAADTHGRYRIGKAERLEGPSSFRVIAVVLRWGALAIGVLSLFFDAPALAKIYSPDGCTITAGSALILLGTSLFILARARLGGAYSPCYDPYMPEKVVMDGVYRFVRHPVYTANWTTLCGVFVMTGSAWIFVGLAVLVVYCVSAAILEERALTSKWPEYQRYVLCTGMFFPRVVRRRRGADSSLARGNGAGAGVFAADQPDCHAKRER